MAGMAALLPTVIGGRNYYESVKKQPKQIKPAQVKNYRDKKAYKLKGIRP